MAGYGVAERKLNDARKILHTCGTCGDAIAKNETVCQSCKDDVFFRVEIESERG
jgi:recombinational DNA repair protein RecR